MEFSIMVLISCLNILSYSTHPLMLCVLLIGMAITLSVLLNSLLNKWLMLSLILIFLGGMMVIFIYMTTLASNEKLLMPHFLTKFMFFLLLAICTMIPNFYKTEFLAMSSTYSLHMSPLLLFLAMYLLICLFAIVKLCNSFKGALMKFN